TATLPADAINSIASHATCSRRCTGCPALSTRVSTQAPCRSFIDRRTEPLERAAAPTGTVDRLGAASIAPPLDRRRRPVVECPPQRRRLRAGGIRTPIPLPALPPRSKGGRERARERRTLRGSARVRRRRGERGLASPLFQGLRLAGDARGADRSRSRSMRYRARTKRRARLSAATSHTDVIGTVLGSGER